MTEKKEMFRTRQERVIVILIALLLFVIVSLLIGLSIGSVHINLTELRQIIFSHKIGIFSTIIFQVRMPRILCAFIVGGMLALAGVLMQTLLRNPLADPYILGVSGGAAVASLLAVLIGTTAVSLSLWAFLGGLFSIFLVIGLANGRRQKSAVQLLLTGVVIAMGWGAIISFILTVSQDRNLRSMLFWLMGDLSYAHVSIWKGAVLSVGLIVSMALSRSFNLFIFGEKKAESLGVNTKWLHLYLYFMGSLLTACAVSMAGSIGFIGLVVPHMLRLIGLSDHRFLLPASVLLGGGLLVLADTLARTILAPIQLPVGIITAALGVPVFLFLLRRRALI